jgi:hypothetical protein
MTVCHNTDGSVFGISKKHDLSESGPIPIFKQREYKEMSKCSYSHSLGLSLTEYKHIYTLSK